MSSIGTAELEPQSDVDLLGEITSELVSDVAESESAVGENPTQTELAENEVKAEPETNSKLDPVVQKSVDKRIAKEVRKRKELEAELSANREKLNVLESKVGQNENEAKVVDLSDMTPDQLEQADKEAREYMVWAMNGPMENGHEGTDTNGESKFYEPEEIKDIYQHYHRKAMLDIPEAKTQKAKVASQLQHIAELHPQLQNEDSAEYKAFKEVWLSSDFKDMRNTGRGAEYAYAIASSKLREHQKAPTFIPNSPQALAPRVPVAPAPSRARPVASTGNQAITEEDYKRAGSGQIDDIVAKLMN